MNIDAVPLLNWASLTEDDVAKVKVQVKRVLDYCDVVLTENFYCSPTRHNDKIKLVVCVNKNMSYPHHVITIKESSGIVTRVCRVKENDTVNFEDIAKLDQSKSYPVALDNEWELRWGKTRAYLFNKNSSEKRDIKLNIPNKYHCFHLKYLSSQMKFFLLPGLHDKKTFAVVVCRHDNHGIDLFPCRLIIESGEMICTSYPAALDYPEPIAGVVSNNGKELLYRFLSDEPIQETIYRNNENDLSFEDFEWYNINASKWYSIIDDKSF